MVQPDSSSSPSDIPPKRFFKRINAAFGKRFITKLALGKRGHVLSILIPLILINAGILHILVRQVAIKASAQTTTVVKDETSSAPAQGEVTDTDTTEDALPDTGPAVITTYTVKSGDTLSGIAAQFNISVNTIRWANDLTATSAIKPGDQLVILPVSGVQYTVKKGDTLSGISLKFDVDQSDILNYNDIDADSIKQGALLVIPNAEPIAATPKTPKAPAAKSQTKSSPPTPPTQSAPASSDTSSKAASKFSMPIPGAILTQGIHDGNAVDFGAPVGTRVQAAAAGTILIAKSSGYNGGYGEYIVINHPDGSQTLYGHLSKVLVAVGDKVTQGQEIALSGNTGKTTGPHLHYKEMGTGKINTFAKYKVGTQF